jgi:hypothetical protein
MLPCKNGGMKRYCDLTLIVVLLMVFLAPPLSQAATESVIPEGTRITLQLNNHLSTKLNNEGDSFTAVVMVPVYMGDQMVIPKGSLVTGSISRISRPGRFKGKALMTLLFQSINIPGRGELSITASLAGLPEGNGTVRTEGTVEGKGSEGSDAARVLTPGLLGGGIGVLAGGGRGAAIGAGAGVIMGTATVFATRGKDIEFRRGSTMDISLDRPLSIPPEAEAESTTARR